MPEGVVLTKLSSHSFGDKTEIRIPTSPQTYTSFPLVLRLEYANQNSNMRYGVSVTYNNGTTGELKLLVDNIHYTTRYSQYFNLIIPALPNAQNQNSELIITRSSHGDTPIGVSLY